MSHTVTMQPLHAWQSMYPPLHNHRHGWLDVGDGHKVYWETCGNPLGLPALFVHGGPGAGCTTDDRRWFDPRRYLIVLFDQRGAGRSRPPGALAANSTALLVQDMELLRRHLRIERWLLFGGSWGTTLALAYAQRHPDRVRALVLRGVFTATQRERDWLYTARGAAALHPTAWQCLATAAGATGTAADLLPALAQRLHCGNARTEQVAARAWLRWEQDLMDLDALEVPVQSALERPMSTDSHPRNDSVALTSARIGVHFARHAFFLEENQLLLDASKLKEVPGVIGQGGRDHVTPPLAALALHRAWSGSQLRLIATAGHASSHPEMARQLIAATDCFAGQPLQTAVLADGTKAVLSL